MSSRRFSVLAFCLAISIPVILATACSQSAPQPTAAPASSKATPVQSTPGKEAQPTNAPAAAKVDYPQKGKSITIIVPWDAGGAADVGTRLMTPVLEKELGVPIQVVNKPGAGSQTGLAEFARAKPDGYTLGNTNLPNTFLTYMDPDRKSTYGRKDFVPICNIVWDPEAIAVKADSPIKSMKDLVDMAKTKTVKVADIGVLTNSHLDLIALQMETKGQFAPVHFTGGSTNVTALLGDNVDASIQPAGNFGSVAKAGQVRLIGIYDTQRSPVYPNVPTMAEQGFKVGVGGSSRAYSVPVGTPAGVVDVLTAAFKKVAEDQEVKSKLAEMGLELRYMDAKAFNAFWDEWEQRSVPLLDAAKKEAASAPQK